MVLCFRKSIRLFQKSYFIFSGNKMKMYPVCISITVFLGLPANFLVLIYFLFGRLSINRAMKTLHIWIVVTDMLIALSLIPHALEGISNFKIHSPSNYVLCEVLEFSGDMWIRLSFFLICMMSVVRLRLIRRIKSPGMRVKVPVYKILIAAFLFIAIQSLFPVALRHVRGIEQPCIQKNLWEITFPNTVVRKSWRIFTILFQVLGAMLVILIANSISIYHLLRDKGRKRSSVERLAIQLINNHLRRRRSVIEEPNSLRVKTFAARVKAASITFTLSFVFFSLHIAGVIHICCRILQIDSRINGEIANSTSFLTPAVQCIVYGLKFKGFWVFWYERLLDMVRKIKDMLGRGPVDVGQGQSQELLNNRCVITSVSRMGVEINTEGSVTV